MNRAIPNHLQGSDVARAAMQSAKLQYGLDLASPESWPERAAGFIEGFCAHAAAHKIATSTDFITGESIRVCAELDDCYAQRDALRASRDALVAALSKIADSDDSGEQTRIAYAAIAAAKAVQP